MISSKAMHFTYPGEDRLVFPDIEVPQGGVLLLTGPSGCGKSTWLALAAGLVSVGGGLLVVADQNLNLLQARQKDRWRAKSIGFLPQKLHLSSALTVAQNLALVQWAAGQPGHNIAILQCLQSLGIEALAARKPSQISGGQAQRVALARAVLLNPKVILADEPTASLDDEAAHDAIKLLLQTARRHHATLVVATHDARVKALIQVVQPTAQGQTIHFLELGRRDGKVARVEG